MANPVLYTGCFRGFLSLIETVFCIFLEYSFFARIKLSVSRKWTIRLFFGNELENDCVKNCDVIVEHLVYEIIKCNKSLLLNAF